MCIIGYQVWGIRSTKVKFEVTTVVSTVCDLLAHLNFLEHKIQGDTLCDINADSLKSLGVTTIGQRLSILKAIYQVKVAHNIPIGEQQYVPPCEYHFVGLPSRTDSVH